ncbi:uncharacterized protein LOC125237049 [Leguminivora glycinivorella]|uniref:uncharacterized protein LOC125237049 n=1 Tax=Leguminivora glycinivorella TaxID=1035111 RepID=UPI00200F5D8B|nr:uncharacterized protein LOC125237049 [Leguminivora glycinivorella]
MEKVEAAIDSLKTTYLYRPILYGEYVEGTIRSYNIFKSDAGRDVFGTLNGDLKESFKSIIGRRPRTGDIISCRIPKNRMAEHYMMFLNDKVIEVAVVGGKSTHDGIVMMSSFRNSTYANSTQCLFHENRVMARAREISDEKHDDTESDKKQDEIINRIDCTINGTKPGRFHYDLLSCNCQDVVLYWAYGYAENTCLKNFGCFDYLMYSFDQIYKYVDEEAFTHYETNKDSGDLLNAAAKVIFT